MTDWLQLCDEIDDGEHDDGLEDIAKAIQSRRDVVHRRTARRLAREIQKDDRVMLTNRVTPRYLEGCSGTVLRVKQDQGAAVVQLDSLPTHRGRPSAQGPQDKLLVPFIHLVKIDDDVKTLRNTDDAADIGDDDELEEDDED
jgi:hypothetical protein